MKTLKFLSKMYYLFWKTESKNPLEATKVPYENSPFIKKNLSSKHLIVHVSLHTHGWKSITQWIMGLRNSRLQIPTVDLFKQKQNACVDLGKLSPPWDYPSNITLPMQSQKEVKPGSLWGPQVHSLVFWETFARNNILPLGYIVPVLFHNSNVVCSGNCTNQPRQTQECEKKDAANRLLPRHLWM